MYLWELYILLAKQIFKKHIWLYPIIKKFRWISWIFVYIFKDRYDRFFTKKLKYAHLDFTAGTYSFKWKTIGEISRENMNWNDFSKSSDYNTHKCLMNEMLLASVLVFHRKWKCTQFFTTFKNIVTGLHSPYQNTFSSPRVPGFLNPMKLQFIFA